MNAGYFDVRNGCAGDMIAAALVTCGDEMQLREELKKVDFPHPFELKIERVSRHNPVGHPFEATRFQVIPAEKEHGRHYIDILQIFEKSLLSLSVKKRIFSILDVLAVAEATVHGETKETVHFHEVGQTDALVEIASAAILLEQMEVATLASSPVGLSCTAPATLEMAKGVPTLFKDIPFEITTPTGMAIIKGSVSSFDMPKPMNLIQHGFGAGENLSVSPNVLTFALGATKTSASVETIAVVETTIDDSNPILFESLLEDLHAAGALEVTFFSGTAKKSRPAFSLRALCEPDKTEAIAEIFFRSSTTLGVRFREESRYVLERSTKKVSTKWGEITVKIGYYAGKPINALPEYEECKAAARLHNVPVKTVFHDTIRAIDFNNPQKKV